MIAFSFVVLPTSVHALSLNDIISSIASVFTGQPSTSSIGGGSAVPVCSFGTVNSTNPLVYRANPSGTITYYSIYADLGSTNNLARIIVKDSSGSTLATQIINQGDSFDFTTQGITVEIINVTALQDGTVVGINLVVGPIGVVCYYQTTTTTTIGTCRCPDGFVPNSDGTLCWQPCTSLPSQPRCTPVVAPCQSTTTTTTTTTIFCTNDFDCPSKMKCTNYTCPVCPTGAACAPCMPNHCVDVGCVPEGGYIPGAISPDYKNHMATECCQGLSVIEPSQRFDQNCNRVPIAGEPSGVCSKCGNGVCGPGENKCNCPQDCGGSTCPYECCENDPLYLNKLCPRVMCDCMPGTECSCPNYVCKNHQCVSQFSSSTINYKAGWNLFSVPVKNVVATSSTNCSPVSPIYGYSNGNYYQTTYTTGGNGYWVKMNSDCSVTFTGSTITINDFPTLNQGWNLIGAPSTSTNFADVIGNCNVLSGPFWYNPTTNSYIQSSTFEPSKGYFVKVSANCQLGAGLPPLPPQ